MAETYIQMFQEKFYPAAFQKMAEKTIRKFLDKEKQITEAWKRELGRYMEDIAGLQEEGSAEPVAELDISFLYTSLDEGQPRFRIDSYKEGGRLFHESMKTAYLKADWMTLELDGMAEQLKEYAEKESLRRYIRPAEYEVLKLRAARSLLYHFTDRFKYAIWDVLNQKSLAKMQKAEVFVIQMGEYMDWQKTIYAILPEIDIFNCDKSAKLRFRHFPAIYYKEKTFQKLDLSQSRFEDCSFEDTAIEGGCMNDCIFDGCTFENVTITGTQMAGSLFRNCTMKHVKFENIVFCGVGIEGHESEYFEPSEFRGCTFLTGSFRECQLANSIAVNCDVQELEFVDCNARDSGFLEMDGIAWRQESQEG